MGYISARYVEKNIIEVLSIMDRLEQEQIP